MMAKKSKPCKMEARQIPEIVAILESLMGISVLWEVSVAAAEVVFLDEEKGAYPCYRRHHCVFHPANFDLNLDLC